ncbi:2-phospho-L-lactate guanylyltransferase, partial [Cellulomonas shaoxiangyii]
HAGEAGLDAAVLAGAAHARGLAPHAPVAVVLGDLPRLDPTDLDAAPASAAGHARAHVPDAAGTGTTLLTASTGRTLRPRFGAGSSHRHAAAGHVRLDVPRSSSLRHDVDHPADLVLLAGQDAWPSALPEK